MTRDDIIQMAREAGFPCIGDRPILASGEEAMQRFAALVAEREREACAKVCDEAHELMNSSFQGAAAAIRARSNT